MSFIASMGSQGKWMEEVVEAKRRSPEVAEAATGEDPLSIRDNIPKDVFETYKYHQFTRGTAHPSQVVTGDQLTFIMMYYMEIEQFYAAGTVATDLVKDTIGAAIATVTTKQETTFDKFEEQYFAAEDDVVGEEMNELIKEQWETEMDQYYRDQRDLCDIMD